MRKRGVVLLAVFLLFLPHREAKALSLSQLGLNSYHVVQAIVQYGSSKAPYFIARVGGVPLLFTIGLSAFQYISNWIDDWNRQLPTPGARCYAKCPPPWNTNAMCRYIVRSDCRLILDAVYVSGTPLCGSVEATQYGCEIATSQKVPSNVAQGISASPVVGDAVPPPDQLTVPDLSDAVVDPSAFSTAIQFALVAPETAEQNSQYEEYISDPSTSDPTTGASSSVPSAGGISASSSSGSVSASPSQVAGKTVGGSVSVSDTVSLGNLSSPEAVSGSFDTRITVPEMKPLDPTVPNMNFTVQTYAPTCRVGGVRIFGEEISFDFCPWERYIDLLGDLLVWFLRGFALFYILRI